MFIYIWFETVGWSLDEPTPEDEKLIENGELTVLLINTDVVPTTWCGNLIEECKVEETPDGDRYHYV